jgi:hypothetical protein
MWSTYPYLCVYFLGCAINKKLWFQKEKKLDFNCIFVFYV